MTLNSRTIGDLELTLCIIGDLELTLFTISDLGSCDAGFFDAGTIPDFGAAVIGTSGEQRIIAIYSDPKTGQKSHTNSSNTKHLVFRPNQLDISLQFPLFRMSVL